MATEKAPEASSADHDRFLRYNIQSRLLGIRIVIAFPGGRNPLQAENIDDLRIGAAEGSFIRILLPRKRAAKAKRRDIGQKRGKGAHTKTAGSISSHDKLITDFVTGGAIFQLRYQRDFYVVSFCHNHLYHLCAAAYRQICPRYKSGPFHTIEQNRPGNIFRLGQSFQRRSVGCGLLHFLGLIGRGIS